MVDEGLANDRTSPPTRGDIVQWTWNASQNLQPQLIRNAWRHGDYTWFSDEAANA
jgi:hypothetical protein